MARYVEYTNFCKCVEFLIEKKAYDECYKLLTNYIGKYPDSAEIHNLLGILYEKKGNHLLAMRHFRASLDLEPSYLPAKYNLDSFGTFNNNRKCYFCLEDCR